MHAVAKVLEALGIAFVFLGLLLGINSPTLWIELYLSIIGVVVFLIGWGTDKLLERKRRESSQ
ncbi:MAG: hypothetical protein HY961_11300 [Ignavibacteriae bacterium]|nr:hypothetical protein [Ignavibacteriota bacterium]